MGAFIHSETCIILHKSFLFSFQLKLAHNNVQPFTCLKLLIDLSLEPFRQKSHCKTLKQVTHKLHEKTVSMSLYLIPWIVYTYCHSHSNWKILITAWNSKYI